MMTSGSEDDLARIPALDALTGEQRARLAEIARPVRFAAGERLFDEGAGADRCWFVESGRIALATDVPGVGEMVVQTLGAGEVLGWSWLVPPFRWHFSATAMAPTTALELDAAALQALAEEDPRFGYVFTRSLFGVLLHRLQATRARLLDLYGTADAR